MSIENNNSFENKSLRELETAKILAESKQNKDLLKENISQGIINKLKSPEGYKVRSSDELGLINKITSKGNHIDFNDEGDKIWPGDVITIEGKKVIRTHNGDSVKVGVVTKGFEKKDDDDLVVLPIEDSSSASKNNKPNTPDSSSSNSSNNTPPVINSNYTASSNTPPTINGSDVNFPNDGSDNNSSVAIIPSVQKTKEGLQHDNEQISLRFELAKEQLEKLTKNYPKVMLLNDVVQIWVSAAKKEASSEFGEMLKFGETDKEIIEKQISEVLNAYNILLNKTENFDRISDDEIKNIFNIMQKAEKAETIITHLDIVKNEVLVTNFDNAEKQRFEILNLMRKRTGGMVEGNSALVGYKMGDMLLAKEDFAEIKKVIYDDNTYELIKGGISNLQALIDLGITEKLAKDLINKEGEIERLQRKNKEIFIEQVKNENPGITDPTEINRLTEEKIKTSIKGSIIDLLKKGLLFNKLSKDKTLAGKDELTKAYSNTVGVGIFTFSDETIASSVEVGLILATSFVPLGVGLKAAGVAGKVVGNLWKVKNATGIGRAAILSAKSLNIARGATIISAEGFAFYETSNLMHNAMFKQYANQLTEGWRNGTEIAKSIAFFGVMKGFSKFVGTEKIKSLTDKVPSGILKKSGAILAEGGTLTVTGTEIEKLFSPENDVHYTWASYIEAMMMVFILKKIGGKLPENKQNQEVIKHIEKIKILEKRIQRIKNNKLLTSSQKQEKINNLNESIKVHEGKISILGNSTRKEKTNITYYEAKRFKNLVSNKLKDKNNITLENSLGEKLTIVKQSNGKFLIDGKGKPLTSKEMISKINNSYKIEFINKTNLEQLTKIDGSQEFNLLRSLGHPINGKIQVEKGGKVTLNGKELKPERVKQVLKIPTIREAVLKQRLENMTNAEFFNKLSGLKGFEGIKQFGTGAIKVGTERFKALLISGLIGGISNVMFEIIFDGFSAGERGEAPDKRFWELIKIFTMGAIGGLAISGTISGTMFVWGTLKTGGKLGWKAVEIPAKFLLKHKKKTLAGVGAGASLGYIFLTPEEQKEIEENTQ